MARHTFSSARMLTPGDSADRWREVTPAQRKAIEREDAEREEPTAELVADAEDLGVEYDSAKGKFLHNGLELTAAEMRTVLTQGVTRYPSPARIGSTCRTNILVYPRKVYTKSMWRVNFTSFAASSDVETIAIAADDSTFTQASECAAIIFGTPRLRRVIGILDVYYVPASTFSNSTWCQSSGVETLKISRIRFDFNASQLKNISPESVEFWVDNRSETKLITITLHAEAFGRLTPELIAKAAERQITFASA